MGSDTVVRPLHHHFPNGPSRRPEVALCQRERCAVYRLLTGVPSVLSGTQRRYFTSDVLRSLGTAAGYQEERALLQASMAMCTDWPLEVEPIAAPVPGILGPFYKEPD